MDDPIKGRDMAMIGKILAVSVEPGTQIFDLETGNRLGIVADRMPVANHRTSTVYLSTNDYQAAKRALPNRLPKRH